MCIEGSLYDDVALLAVSYALDGIHVSLYAMSHVCHSRDHIDGYT